MSDSTNPTPQSADAVAKRICDAYRHPSNWPFPYDGPRQKLHAIIMAELAPILEQLADAQSLFKVVCELAPDLKNEDAENFSGYFIHWDEVTESLSRAWPGKNVGYSESPLELVARLIDERDELQRQSESQRKRFGELEESQFKTVDGVSIGLDSTIYYDNSDHHLKYCLGDEPIIEATIVGMGLLDGDWIAILQPGSSVSAVGELLRCYGTRAAALASSPPEETK